MQAFEPMIEVATLLTVLSVLAERITNLVKLRDVNLRVKRKDLDSERQRELGISARSAVVGVFVALLVKANLFEILAATEDPWRTLGWVQAHGNKWVRAPVVATPGGLVYVVAGCVITGLALGFGSKFWHDVAGAVYEVRDLARSRNENKPTRSAVAEGTRPAEEH